MNENKIGKLLQKQRKNRGLTQDSLASKLGVTFQAVSKWERGENLPDSMTLLELSKMYGITVDEILKGELLVKIESDLISLKTRNILLIGSIFLYILCPIPSLINYKVTGEYGFLGIIGTLICVAVATGVIIYMGIKYGHTFNKSSNHKTKEEQRIENIVYASCLVIFMVLGLIWNLFNISWIVFIIGYIIILIINGKKE